MYLCEWSLVPQQTLCWVVIEIPLFWALPSWMQARPWSVLLCDLVLQPWSLALVAALVAVSLPTLLPAVLPTRTPKCLTVFLRQLKTPSWADSKLIGGWLWLSILEVTIFTGPGVFMSSRIPARGKEKGSLEIKSLFRFVPCRALAPTPLLVPGG